MLHDLLRLCFSRWPVCRSLSHDEHFSGDLSFKIRRLLPLPSSDWRDFSQDRFCGCCDDHHSADLDQLVAVEVAETNSSSLDRSSSKAEITNKRLTTTSLDPRRLGDVFCSTFAVGQASSNFNIQDFEDLEHSDRYRPSVLDLGAFNCKKLQTRTWT